MKTLLIFILSAVTGLNVSGQELFRSGIFLHHSTGQNIWGPNGSATSVPDQMNIYNTAHGYNGSQAVTMNEEWWTPDDNEWVTQHTFFEDPSPLTGIGYYLPANKIIVIKSCFPSSAMESAGSPGDTLSPDMKTIYNYKWHWRHIVKVMRSHPDNFFVIWTNAPLEPASTNADEAALSNWFCTWAKDTLAAGLDPLTGPFPENVYVFDYFHKVAGSDGMELIQYRVGPGDSHPNAAATELVAPQFVTEIFNAAIAYELIFGTGDAGKQDALALFASPNPFLAETEIHFKISGKRNADLALFDISGKAVKTLWSGNQAGDHTVRVSGKELSAGTYFVKLSDEGSARMIRVIHRTR